MEDFKILISKEKSKRIQAILIILILAIYYGVFYLLKGFSLSGNELYEVMTASFSSALVIMSAATFILGIVSATMIATKNTKAKRFILITSISTTAILIMLTVVIFFIIAGIYTDTINNEMITLIVSSSVVSGLAVGIALALTILIGDGKIKIRASKKFVALRVGLGIIVFVVGMLFPLFI